jgi:hypothetical protein
VLSTLRKFLRCCHSHYIYTNIIISTSGQRSFDAFAKAASDSDDSKEPQSTGGGEIGSATATGSASGGSATGTTETGTAASATATESTGANAGLEARGEIRWGLMSFGVAMAGVFGGLMM